MTAGYASETSKYRHETVRYCDGMGIDLGSGGDPVKPDFCISFDIGGHLKANVGNKVDAIGDARNLGCYADNCFDFVYSSHLLEDFPRYEWPTILAEWHRVLRPEGNLVLLLPDWKLYRDSAGNDWNRSHQHEPLEGELSCFYRRFFPRFEVLQDRLAEPVKYTILFVARKPVS